jgi:hypothetical protein
VLAHCEAPYSPMFARSMIALMAQCGLSKMREGGRHGELRALLLKDFVADVREMQFDEPLSEGQRTYLADLSSDFYYT